MTIGNRNRARTGGGGSGGGQQIRWLDLPQGATAKTGLDLDPRSGGYSFDRGRIVRLSTEFALAADGYGRSPLWNFLFGHESYDDRDGRKLRLFGSDWPPYFQNAYDNYAPAQGTRYALTGYVDPGARYRGFSLEDEQGQGDGIDVYPNGYAEPGTTFRIGGADTVLNNFQGFSDRTRPGLIGRTALWYDDGDYGEVVCDFVPRKLPDGTRGFMDVAGDRGSFLSSATETPFQEGSL